jgi:translation initiation factor IF-2
MRTTCNLGSLVSCLSNITSSLRRFKDNVKEVKSGTECGIGVAGYDVEAGDQIEVFERVESARTL